MAKRRLEELKPSPKKSTIQKGKEAKGYEIGGIMDDPHFELNKCKDSHPTFPATFNDERKNRLMKFVHYLDYLIKSNQLVPHLPPISELKKKEWILSHCNIKTRSDAKFMFDKIRANLITFDIFYATLEKCANIFNEKIKKKYNEGSDYRYILIPIVTSGETISCSKGLWISFLLYPMLSIKPFDILFDQSEINSQVSLEVNLGISTFLFVYDALTNDCITQLTNFAHLINGLITRRTSSFCPIADYFAVIPFTIRSNKLKLRDSAPIIQTISAEIHPLFTDEEKKLNIYGNREIANYALEYNFPWEDFSIDKSGIVEIGPTDEEIKYQEWCKTGLTRKAFKMFDPSFLPIYLNNPVCHDSLFASMKETTKSKDAVGIAPTIAPVPAPAPATITAPVSIINVPPVLPSLLPSLLPRPAMLPIISGAPMTNTFYYRRMFGPESDCFKTSIFRPESSLPGRGKVGKEIKLLGEGSYGKIQTGCIPGEGKEPIDCNYAIKIISGIGQKITLSWAEKEYYFLVLLQSITLNDKPIVPRVIDSWVCDTNFYIVMEKFEGNMSTLGEYQYGLLPKDTFPAELIKLVKPVLYKIDQLVRMFQIAHIISLQGIVFGDLKLDQFLWNSDNIVVTDFVFAGGDENKPDIYKMFQPTHGWTRNKFTIPSASLTKPNISQSFNIAQLDFELLNGITYVINPVTSVISRYMGFEYPVTFENEMNNQSPDWLAKMIDVKEKTARDNNLMGLPAILLNHTSIGF